ncbi:MAG: DUF3598 family protein [Leptolyngbya sp. SIOISBB]|nr:DUF3598 family protein [Leptolyngbya sp. SIOISBB]
MASQWERLLKNTGRWVGSFTRLSPQGELLSDIPTVVELKPLDHGNLMYQTVTKQPPGKPPEEMVLQYRTLARNLLFLENGAFSQGAMQWGPFSGFGAELGLMVDNHRLRLVQLFDNHREFQQLTLIREHREGTAPSTRSKLMVDDLVGTWEGEAVTVYPDLQPDDTYATHLEITHQNGTVEQTLQFGETAPPIKSQGVVSGDRILFTSGSQSVQVLLLPDGASSTCPVQIEPRQPLFLEVGWLISPHHRQRLIRQYSAQGTWVSLTLVDETKVDTQRVSQPD